MIDLQQLEDNIVKLSLLDAAALVKSLEKRLGVSATPQPVEVTPSQVKEVKIEEQTEFSVVLKEVGMKKINVIKAVREVTDLGLKEAKDFIEVAPKIIKEGITKEEAERISKKLTDAGAEVEIR